MFLCTDTQPPDYMFQNAEHYSTCIHCCKTSNPKHLFGVSVSSFTDAQSDFFEHEIKDTPVQGGHVVM